MARRSSAQVERQRARSSSSGKYRKFNPCEICGVSTGEDYYSDPRANSTGKGMVLCEADAAALQDLSDGAFLKAFTKAR